MGRVTCLSKFSKYESNETFEEKVKDFDEICILDYVPVYFWMNVLYYVDLFVGIF